MRDPQACGGPRKLGVVIRKLVAGHRSSWWRSASLWQLTEACGGDPQACGSSQKLVVAIRKLVAAHRSLWWRSVSLWQLAEACGGDPRACGSSQKLVVAIRKLVAARRSLWWRSASLWRATEACDGDPQACGGPHLVRSPFLSQDSEDDTVDWPVRPNGPGDSIPGLRPVGRCPGQQAPQPCGLEGRENQNGKLSRLRQKLSRLSGRGG